jgi:ABC-type antimicrobial peptide transport system permease subunit
VARDTTLLAFRVAERTREIGVRMALGAQPRQVRRMFLKRVMSQVALGFAGGVICTIGWSRMFSTGRAQVNVTDPVGLAIVAAILIAVAALATLVPVRRATRLDPIRAIRSE